MYAASLHQAVKSMVTPTQRKILHCERFDFTRCDWLIATHIVSLSVPSAVHDVLCRQVRTNTIVLKAFPTYKQLCYSFNQPFTSKN